MDVVVEIVDLEVEVLLFMMLVSVLVLLPPLVVELAKQERSHKSSSHPSLTLVPVKVGAEVPWRLYGGLYRRVIATAETKVDMHLVAVSVADEEGFYILHTKECITDKPLPFKDDEVVIVMKPQVMVDEGTGKTFVHLKKKDLERQPKIFEELFEDLGYNNVLPQRLPHRPSTVLPEPVTKEMPLAKKESNEKVCCLCN